MAAAVLLERTQRWMQSVISDPAGVESGMASPSARAEFGIAPDEIERIVTRSRRLPAAERLAVYHNAYFARLLDCLREEFPVFLSTVGDEVFDEFAVDYLMENPSRDYTLASLGANFAGYLSKSRPPDEEDSRWSDFLIDLATLERAIGDVFDGPGSETERPFDARALAEIPTAAWQDARIVTAPSLRLYSLRFPLHDYYRSMRKDEDTPLPEPKPTNLAIHRRDYVVHLTELDNVEFILLSGLSIGLPMGDAIAQALESDHSDMEILTARLLDQFRCWTEAGFFRAIEIA